MRAKEDALSRVAFRGAVLFCLAAGLLLTAWRPLLALDEATAPEAAAPLSATLLWEVEAWEGGIIEFGWSVAPVGDINGDGKMDIVVGAPGSIGGGKAFILSGADGSVLRTYRGSDDPHNADFGYSVQPAGDYDGDGTYDILVGAMGAACGPCELGYAQVLSGAAGCPELGAECILMTVEGYSPYEQFGSSVAAIGDLNGDERSEILVGAPGTGPGSARLFSSIDGSVMLSVDGTGQDKLGQSVAAVGDVTGDRKPDFMIGAPGAAPGGISSAGRAFLYSGATRQVKRTWSGKTIGQGVGRWVAGAGRTNKDRYADIIIASPGASPGGRQRAGSVKVRSGRDNLVLLLVNGKTANGYTGWAAAAAGDVNGDGKGDILVGAPGLAGSGGKVQLISGANGSTLYTYEGEAGDSVGWAMAAADANGDGKPDIVIGGWHRSVGTGSGYVRVISFSP